MTGSDVVDEAGGRLPLLRKDQLDETGSALWDDIVANRGQAAVSPDGHLAGPFNAWAHAPGVGTALLEVGTVLRFGTSLEPAVVETAIMTVAAHWRTEFEWMAHSERARQLGIPADVIAAIQRGEAPRIADEDQRLAQAVAHQLVEGGQVDAATHGAARARFGDRGLVELVALCGYYCLVSFVLNAFEVPLPAGVERAWRPDPT